MTPRTRIRTALLVALIATIGLAATSRTPAAEGIQPKTIPACDKSEALGLSRIVEIEPDQQALGLLAAVQFDITAHDVRAFAPPALRGLQHGVAFANSRIGAKENSELPASRARLPGLQPGQQLIRIGTVIVHCAQGRDA